MHSINFVRPLPLQKCVTVSAEPLPVHIDLARTALLIIDMQNDFIHEHGWFGSRGVPAEQALALVPQINGITSALREIDVPIIWLNWGVRPDLAEMPDALVARSEHRMGGLSYGSPSPSNNGRILVEGEWGAEIIEQLDVKSGDLTVSKPRYSGFAHTTLDAILRKLDVTTLLFAGVNTDRCVYATLLDAGGLGYDCVLLSDATATPAPQATTEAIHDLVTGLHGVVTSSVQILKELPSLKNEGNP